MLFHQFDNNIYYELMLDRYGNKILVTDELPDGQMVDQWEPVSCDSVKTPLEVLVYKFTVSKTKRKKIEAFIYVQIINALFLLNIHHKVTFSLILGVPRIAARRLPC